MRRLPIYILIDSSGSMRGEPIEAVRVGLETLVASLRRDPYALETVWLSVISFDREAKVVVPLTDIETFAVPSIPVPETSPTNLGEALELLTERYRLEVQKTTQDQKGDWLPLLVIMTDGAPSDVFLFKQMTANLKSYKFARIICCAAGPKAKVEPLKELTKDVYALDTMDAATFSKFWKWVSVAAEQQTRSTLCNDVDFIDDPPPPPPEEIRLVF